MIQPRPHIPAAKPQPAAKIAAPTSSAEGTGIGVDCEAAAASLAKAIATHGLTKSSNSAAAAHSSSGAPPAPAPPNFFTFHPPSYYLNYQLAKDAILVGDCHLTRGDLTVIGGVPGCGKSRLLVSLAIAGKQGAGATWMGLDVHHSFKTAILQAENGEVRLQRELQDIHDQGHDLDGWLYLTPPPPFGIAFSAPAFRDQLREWLLEVQPGVLAIDPWNRCVADDKAKDYREILDSVFAILPEGPLKPAIIIIHHLRKPSGSDNNRRRGRELLHELSGSYVIGSASRVAFILEPATPDGDDDRVLFTCAKNNNGDMGAPSAWHRRNGLFDACTDFDFKTVDKKGSGGGEESKRGGVVEFKHLAAVFEMSGKPMNKPDIVANLMLMHGVSRSCAYEALKPGGKFAKHLTYNKGSLHFTAEPKSSSQPPSASDVHETP
jgi:hypothetical protein